VHLDGLLRDAEVGADFLVGEPIAQVTQYVDLAIRELRDRTRRVADVAVGGMARGRHQQRRHVDVSRQHQLQRRDHGLRRGRFRDVARRARVDHATHVARALGARQHDDRQIRVAARELADRGFAAHARHQQVHEHGVEDFLVDHAQRVFGRGGLPNNHVLGGLAQQRREAVAEQGMIVNDEQLHAAHINECVARWAIGWRLFAIVTGAHRPKDLRPRARPSGQLPQCGPGGEMPSQGGT